MLYKKSGTEKLDEKLFENPDKEYRGAPFWAWNCVLRREELLWQIDRLKEMGFGGFFMHTRCGMNTEYLGKEFMELIKACDEHAKQTDMLAYLYDEDRWASGAAGGYVTENKKYRNKFLEFTTENPETFIANRSSEQRDPVYLTSFDVVLDKDGNLVGYERIDASAKAKGVKWHVFRTLAAPTGWFNGYTYIDAMCDEAVDKFIECTYEAYKKAVGKDFGKSVPAIFTDEPNIGHGHQGPKFALSTDSFSYTWTDDFNETFRKSCGYDLISRLPELVWDYKDKPNTVRYDFRNHACERFANAFSRKIGKWCEKNGIAFTGHVLDEPTLSSQTFSVGETMRHYGSYGIPGIDMLCNFVELSTAKQCQSAVHQYGKEGMTSELYGVTGWDFDFRGHKFQGDWQAALGVTLRVPHLSWVSMKGSAKRDYPASISYQSSWFRQYPFIEDHYARLNTVLTRGKPVVRLGVIHPIESYWINAGPVDKCSNVCSQLEERFTDTINWLLKGSMDFDFIAESTLPELYKKSDKGFRVGEMTYSAVLVPPVQTLRSTTVAALTEFLNAGGKVVFSGRCPSLMDARPSDGVKNLYDRAGKTEFSYADILEAFDGEREVDIINSDGTKTDNLIYNLRQDGADRWLFIARFVQPVRYNGVECHPQQIKIMLTGKYAPVIYDTITGEILPLSYKIENGKTIINYTLQASDSLLLRLAPAEKEGDFVQPGQAEKTVLKVIDFPDKAEFELSEPNVLVLDMCEYSWDKKTWYGPEEILRIDEKIRNEFNYPYADGHDVQPWKIPETKPDKFPYLRFTFESETEADCRLAFEEATEITFNGVSVPVKPDGWYIDKDIRTLKLPPVNKGTNELIVRAPISKRVSLENMFLLGSFGVRVEGRKAVVTALPDKLAFGSVTDQGLPFYGAEITYKLPFECDGGDIRITQDYYCGAVIGVKLDGKDVGRIAFAPFNLDVRNVSKGKHELKLTLYATRINTCGALHDCTDRQWKGANMWYTRGAEWSYEYNLKSVGIMKSPEIKIYK